MTFSRLVESNEKTESRIDDFAAMARGIKGIHTVNIVRVRDTEDYLRLYVKGTPGAESIVKGFLKVTDFGSIDQNADHDHDACIRHANSMGVPASWAHTPETYLSM